MWHQYFDHHRLLGLPLLAMVLLLAAFLGIVLRARLTGDSTRERHLAGLPLGEESHPDQRHEVAP